MHIRKSFSTCHKTHVMLHKCTYVVKKYFDLKPTKDLTYISEGISTNTYMREIFCPNLFTEIVVILIPRSPFKIFLSSKGRVE